MLDEAVENSETRGPVGRHAKDVAAENEGPDRQAALAQRAFGHRETPFSTATTASRGRSEEHTSELQSLMRISYAVFCLKKKKTRHKKKCTHERPLCRHKHTYA